MSAKQLWRWQALSPQGEHRHGSLWAAHREDAFAELLQSGLHPLEIRRCALRRSQWNEQHCYEIMRQLATLLQAGLTLAESLQLLSQQHPVRQWQALLQCLSGDLGKGCAFSDALKKWPDVFPPLYVSMIRTGELTGKLDECCRQLAIQQKMQQQLKAKVKKALRYPAIILTLAVAVVLAMVTLVLPEFAAIYKTFNTPLPALTQAVMAMAAFIRQWSVVFIIIVLLPVVWVMSMRRNPRWQHHRQRILLVCPVIGALVRGQKLSHIFTVLSLTQQAGITFLDGLASTEETLECPFWRNVLRKAREKIAHGAPIWSSLNDANVFSPLCIQLVRTGEVSGALDSMLDNLARHHSEQTFQQADNLAALLEPLLLVVTGVIIGTLVVAMYLPIFHLGDAMSASG